MIRQLLSVIILLSTWFSLIGSDSIARPRLISIPKIILSDSTTIAADSIDLKPNILFLPITFIRQQLITDTITFKKYSLHKSSSKSLTVNRKWLDKSILHSNFANYQMNRVIYQTPNLIRYNIRTMPEPPKSYVINVKPNILSVNIDDLRNNKPHDEAPDKASIKYKSWINTLNTSLQFSQAYLSENWYQGGNSNLNILGTFNWNVQLNQNVHPNILFENNILYKLNLSSAPQDTIRSYNISEDLLQINTKFGIKAASKWYYSATMQFKTQLLNNYKPNTEEMKAAFLSPGDLNVGLGMTYNTSNSHKTFSFNMSLAPLSYNMKICNKIDQINPTNYGIEDGKKLKHQYGSNTEMKLQCTLTPNITYTSRLFAFTDYSYLQGDWENTFNFSINKYLSTQLYFHLRYDTSTNSDPTWKKWQFKEILSFGFNYKI